MHGLQTTSNYNIRDSFSDLTKVGVLIQKLNSHMTAYYTVSSKLNCVNRTKHLSYVIGIIAAMHHGIEIKSSVLKRRHSKL